MDLEQLKSIVSQARAAQTIWQGIPFSERCARLRAAAKEMLDRRAEALALVFEETGKNDIDGLFTDALGPVDNINGWISVVKQEIGPRAVSMNPIAFPGKSASIQLVPRGVVGVIAPWNYPIAGLYRAVFPSLLLGNAVVLKPSEYTPKSSSWLCEMLAKHLPEGLIRPVVGDGSVGGLLINSGIDACVFTGSVATGRKVAVQCAERGIPCSTEMGGKDAAIVFADCDLPRTVAGITHWALSNVGQSCGAVELVYVEESIADVFVERLRAAWSQLRVDDGSGASVVDLSPIATDRQLEIVEDQVADALQKGAKLICGGKRLAGRAYLPTVLDYCTSKMKVVADETFGPVVAICRISGFTEAEQAVRQSRYGLGASIWTKDIARAKRLADKLDVGVVNINNHSFTGAIASLPWTGTKDTGFGVANSKFSLLTFARPKTLVVDQSSAMEPFWLPNDPSLREMGHTLAEVLLNRFGGVWKLPFLMRKRANLLKKFYR